MELDKLANVISFSGIQHPVLREAPLVYSKESHEILFSRRTCVGDENNRRVKDLLDDPLAYMDNKIELFITSITTKIKLIKLVLNNLTGILSF